MSIFKRPVIDKTKINEAEIMNTALRVKDRLYYKVHRTNRLKSNGALSEYY
jgi:hypothetical protein